MKYEDKEFIPVLILYLTFSFICGFKNVAFILFSSIAYFVLLIFSTSLIIYIIDKIINYIRI